jgi:hypothetical protein
MKKATGVLSILFLFACPGVVYSQASFFVSFNIRPGENRAVIAEWSVTPAGDTLSFEVEKSNDQKGWKTIAAVPAGSSHQYSFTDPDRGEGMVYYRIRQSAANGTYLYSPVRWIRVNNTSRLFIWPNPASSALYVQTSFNSGSIDVITPSGKHIFKVVITDYITDVPVGNLGKGVYFLQVKHNKEILVEKFFRE